LGVIIDFDRFGLDRNRLMIELDKNQIYTKKYFFPPLHEMQAYLDLDCRGEGLSYTDFVSRNIICLPLYSHMGIDIVERVCAAISEVHKKYTTKRGQEK
ncbi:MAG: DegT/DnrJ/EryC1/StrS family aminotransferase, partial [Burkholderiales bacterium]|nr:DegT/DnrJ/EryC1/StrS family aminotransferase [Burkholderiales bacterium]